jgi:hypothetical protein
MVVVTNLIEYIGIHEYIRDRRSRENSLLLRQKLGVPTGRLLEFQRTRVLLPLLHVVDAQVSSQIASK